jgi:type I restriction enzyme R subunit
VEAPLSPLTPEQQARRAIDEALTVAGWQVQDEEEMNLAAGLGVAVREFPMAPGHGKADCLLFLEGRPVGALEARKAGHTLTGVDLQTKKFSEGLPAYLQGPVEPLSFLPESTGVETRRTKR